MFIHLSIAIVAFILLFATFGVGLRCFSDFDRGLEPSKVNGPSYAPVLTKSDALTGNYSLFSQLSQLDQSTQITSNQQGT